MYKNPSPTYDVRCSFLITMKKSTFSKIIYLKIRASQNIIILLCITLFIEVKIFGLVWL